MPNFIDFASDKFTKRKALSFSIILVRFEGSRTSKPDSISFLATVVSVVDKSISLEGDSGPYLQYSVVRANSVLKKAESEKLKVKSEMPKWWQTTNLERLLERFPSVVFRAGMEYAPHHIVTYLIELAGEFNSFYASHKIIPARFESRSESGRLARRAGACEWGGV